MKLLTRISLNYFLLTALILLLGGFSAYMFVKQEVDEKIDFRLFDDKELIEKISTPAELNEYRPTFADYLEIIPIANPALFQESLIDTLIETPFRSRAIPYRQISFLHKAGGMSYKIVLRKTMVESHDLTDGLYRALLVAGIGLLLVLMITNYLVSKKVWSPFYKSIDTISKYDITRDQAPQLPHVNITEFNELNMAVNQMSDKIQRDYVSLKEFSENASHEMQTPVSVIRSKAELLMQWDGLSNDQLKEIHAIDCASTKLSRLNQALLLLAKIENRQFKHEEEIDLKRMFERHLAEVCELAEMKSLTLEHEIDPAMPIRMNSVLADTLIRNLLSNAIKYCPKDGIIRIRMKDSNLRIANTGEPLVNNPNKLFERFKKDEQASNSLGLGLAIVKKICEYYGFEVRYGYFDGYHNFSVQF